MPSSTPNNPAGRLLRILSRCKTQERRVLQGNAAQGWAKVLDVHEENTPLLLRRIVGVAQLTREIEIKATKLTGINPENLVAWVPKFLAPWKVLNLASSFDQFISPVDETMLAVLRICDDLLSKQMPEPISSEEELAKIHDSLVSLAAEIRVADLPEKFKEYLLHYLEIIENAISDYRVKGSSALREGLEGVIGSYGLNMKYRQQLETDSYGRKVLSLVALYALIVGIVNDTSQLPDVIQKYLPDKSTSLAEPTNELKTEQAVDSN